MVWARMLAYITGTVDQELLLRNEYLAAENRILRAQIKRRMLLSDAEKGTLAEIALVTKDSGKFSWNVSERFVHVGTRWCRRCHLRRRKLITSWTACTDRLPRSVPAGWELRFVACRLRRNSGL